MRVRHRHIIYVQGYDPRGLAQYYRMFRTELRKFGRLYDVSTTVSRPKAAADNETASWTVETAGEEWQSRTTYDFLRWEDLIQPDLAQPIWRRVFHATLIYWRLIFSGTLARLWRAHWRFAIFISYPHLLLYFEAVCSAGISLLLGQLLDAVAMPAAMTVAICAAVFASFLTALLKYTEKRTYLLYLLSDTIFTWEFSQGQRRDWSDRIGRFAQHLVNVTQSSAAEEIVVVGHSSGSFLGTEIMARAFNLDPNLGRHGARVALLTLGGNLPIVGFHHASSQFRDHLRILAVERSIDWIDGQSRKDVMNFYPFDPIIGHGIEPGGDRCNPTIVPVRFREMIKPEHYNSFRWKFFRVHFQFVMASERTHAFDYFMIVCGPVPLRERVAHPAAALAAVAGGAIARESAWKRLETEQGTEAGDLPVLRRGNF